MHLACVKWCGEVQRSPPFHAREKLTGQLDLKQCHTYSPLRSIPEGKLKHPGSWRKKQYNLGRYSGGGYWSCCGNSDKLVTSCDAIMQKRWNLFQIVVDSSTTKRVVRLALVSTIEIPRKIHIIRLTERDQNGTRIWQWSGMIIVSEST